MGSQIIAYILSTIAIGCPIIRIIQYSFIHSKRTNHFLFTNRIMSTMIVQKYYSRERTFTIGYQYISIHTRIPSQIKT